MYLTMLRIILTENTKGFCNGEEVTLPKNSEVFICVKASKEGIIENVNN